VHYGVRYTPIGGDMFGLNKLKFKTKVILVSAIVIIVSMGIVFIQNTTPIIATKIDDWVFVIGNDKGNWYYKSNLIYIDDKTNIIQGWVKIVYTEKGKQEFLNTHKDDKYKNINRSLSKVLINYQKLTYQTDIVYYYSLDNIIGSNKLSVKNDDFIPKSVGSKLLEKIIKDYNIKPVARKPHSSRLAHDFISRRRTLSSAAHSRLYMPRST
jgi:hypothetical protein